MPIVEQVPYRNGHRYRVTGDDRIDDEMLLPTCSGISAYSDNGGANGLMYWAVNLFQDSGHRLEFKEAGERSMAIGTNLHAEIEQYISTDAMPKDHSDLFGAWYSSINEKGVTFHTTEMGVYHPYLLYGGTLDAIGWSSGIPTLFDWKTTDEYKFVRDKGGFVEYDAKTGDLKKERKTASSFTSIPYAAQLGGYMSALRMMAERDDTIVIPEQAFIVYVFKDTKKVRWEKVNLLWAEQIFASCANLDSLVKKSKGELYV
tara:strand:- start:11608 stop:12384 length:777 start_codon:yes stop_codon:yes gene_type:complete